MHRNSMEVESSTYTDFISCDRAGRRNAVHDIQRDATTISMRKLTEDISDLTVEGAGELPQALVTTACGAQPRRTRHETAAKQSPWKPGTTGGCSGDPIPHCSQQEAHRPRASCNQRGGPWGPGARTLQPRSWSCFNRMSTNQQPSQGNIHIKNTLGFIKFMGWEL